MIKLNRCIDQHYKESDLYSFKKCSHTKILTDDYRRFSFSDTNIVLSFLAFNK